jgi:RHS repeat-associated protein
MIQETVFMYDGSSDLCTLRFFASRYTGKERDAESGLDYFGARYYASTMGRWMSPDWADKPEAVPYSSLGNPQSLNLYGYVLNNPLSNADADGHDCCEALQQFASGFADTTYRPIVQAVSHPIDTGSAIISAAAHPINTATAIGNAVVDTGKAALSGDPKALGQVAGTVVSTLATAGVAKAVSGLAEGAEVAGAASKVDSIVNAIDEGGFKVTGNAKGALQESNITITHPNEPGVKLNLRTETHPLEPGGNPVRHTNVERVEPGPKNRPEVKSNTHIDQ